jgi:hypothetical protein
VASLKRSCVGFGPNMPTMTSSEKPQTKAPRPTAPVRTLGRGGRAKVRPATGSTGSVQTKPREPKRRVVLRVSVTPRPSIRPLSSSRHTTCPYLARQLSGFSTADSKFLSIVHRPRMVSAGDNGVYTGSGLRGVIPYVQCVATVFLS